MAKFRMKTKSPLHIGGKDQELYRTEFVVLNDKSYVINEDRLSKELFNLGLIDSFISHVENATRRFNIRDYLREIDRLNHPFLSKVSGYYSQCTSNIQPFRILPFARDSYSNVYIPGTAVKGAIRTAILYSTLKEMKENRPSEFQNKFVSRVQSRVREFENLEARKKGGRKRSFMRTFAEELVEDVFQGFRLESERKKNPRTDILRALKISDSNSIGKNSLRLEEIKVISEDADGWHFSRQRQRRQITQYDIQIFAESVPEDTEFEFDMKIDEKIFSDFERQNPGRLLFESIDDILAMCRTFYSGIIQEEKGFLELTDKDKKLKKLRDFYSDLNANFRLGWGSGMLGTTVNLLLPDDLKLRIRDLFFNRSEVDDFPKSRRVVVENSIPALPFGWVEVSYG